MKKLIIFLFLLFLLPCVGYAQIWEGGGGDSIQEGIGFGSGSGGGWAPEPLNPDMTHYVISFKDDNQTSNLFSPIELNENTVVDLSVFVPTRSEGYDFSHWEDGNGDTVTSVTMTSNQTVYAVWTVHTHSITWQITDYSVEPVATYTSIDNNVAYGSIVVASSAPTVPDGYEFSGWNNLPATMPDYDLTIQGAIERVDIVYQLQEIPYNSNSNTNTRYPIVYGGTIVDYAPITYSGGVVNMGSWGKWINKHFTPVMLKDDGTVDYELSRENQNYKADGVTPSDISNVNYAGNAMLQIKKFYISCRTETVGEVGSQYNVHTISISDTKKDNTYTCWGFVDANGVEHDYAYYGLYMGHIDSNNKLRSIAGIDLTQKVSFDTYTNLNTAAHANGNGYAISNLALENAIGLVMMMIYKDVNPMFVNQDYYNPSTNIVYIQSANVNKITGSRADTGGFPYTTNDQQCKALWVENYWRGAGSSSSWGTWVNGIGSAKKTIDGNNVVVTYYKLKEPFDLTNMNSWTYMDNTKIYVKGSNPSHQIDTVTFYDNIMFPANDGYGSSGSVARDHFMDIRAFGGGDLNASSVSYHYSDKLSEGVKGGNIALSQYVAPAHFLSYLLYGTQSNWKSSARLIYLPQSGN